MHLDRIVLVTKLEMKPGINRRLEATPAAARCQPGTSPRGRGDHGINPFSCDFVPSRSDEIKKCRVSLLVRIVVGIVVRGSPDSARGPHRGSPSLGACSESTKPHGACDRARPPAIASARTTKHDPPGQATACQLASETSSSWSTNNPIQCVSSSHGSSRSGCLAAWAPWRVPSPGAGLPGESGSSDRRGRDASPARREACGTPHSAREAKPDNARRSRGVLRGLGRRSVFSMALQTGRVIVRTVPDARPWGSWQFTQLSDPALSR